MRLVARLLIDTSGILNRSIIDYCLLQGHDILPPASLPQLHAHRRRAMPRMNQHWWDALAHRLLDPPRPCFVPFSGEGSNKLWVMPGYVFVAPILAERSDIGSDDSWFLRHWYASSSHRMTRIGWNIVRWLHRRRHSNQDIDLILNTSKTELRSYDPRWSDAYIVLR